MTTTDELTTEQHFIDIIQACADGVNTNKLTVGLAALEAKRLFGTTANYIGKCVNGMTAATIRGHRRVVKAYGHADGSDVDDPDASWVDNARALELIERPGVMYTHLRTALELPTVFDALIAIKRIPAGGDVMTDEQFRRMVGLRLKTHKEWTPTTAAERLEQLIGHVEEIAVRIQNNYWRMPNDERGRAEALRLVREIVTAAATLGIRLDGAEIVSHETEKDETS